MPSVEIISQGAAIAGYAVGQFAEYHAARHQQANAEALIEAAGIAHQTTPENEVPRKGVMQRFLGNKAVAPLALIGAGTLGLGTYAALQEPETTYSQDVPKLEIVVDHSGATQLPFGGEPSVETINDLAAEFVSKQIEAEALVAGDGKVHSTSIEKIDDFPPFGEAPLAQAASLGLDKAGQNGELLIITNGNQLDNTQELSDQAEKTGAKVYIVNIESGETSDNLDDEQQLAENSGGKYWNADEANLEDVADEVHDTLIPATSEDSGSKKWPIPEFMLMLGLAGVGYYSRKKAATIASLKTPRGNK